MTKEVTNFNNKNQNAASSPGNQRGSSKNGRTIAEINEKIKNGDVQVLTAKEMKELVESQGVEVAYEEVDVVTAGTFGAMCSSGAIVNLGHTDPPIKIDRAWINDVEAFHPGAAVDLYIGATVMSQKKRIQYGGAHVIEDLIRGKEVDLRATAHGTDCYPRTRLETTLTKHDLNQFYLVNFRNCYQRYECATNSRDEIIYTYMGKLLPHFGNATYSGSGSLNPLMNDPDYETIGVGTRIFIGGAQGYILGEGTQHHPQNRMGTIMVRGDCKQMDPELVRGASFTNYGTTLYLGIGVPIPILNPGLAKKTAIRDEDIYTDIIDYGVPRRNRPKVGTVNYHQLKSGEIPLKDKTVKVSSLSSLKKAREITEILKRQIKNGMFYLSSPSESLPLKTKFKPAKQSRELRFVGSILQPAVTCRVDEDISTVAKRFVDRGVNHIVAVDEQGILKGIVTSWDITKAVAEDTKELGEILVRRVITTTTNESLEAASRKMSRREISALPVVDHQRKVIGIVTSENISRLIGGQGR